MITGGIQHDVNGGCRRHMDFKIFEEADNRLAVNRGIFLMHQAPIFQIESADNVHAFLPRSRRQFFACAAAYPAISHARLVCRVNAVHKDDFFFVGQRSLEVLVKSDKGFLLCLVGLGRLGRRLYDNQLLLSPPLCVGD